VFYGVTIPPPGLGIWRCGDRRSRRGRISSPRFHATAIAGDKAIASYDSPYGRVEEFKYADPSQVVGGG